MGEVTPDLKKLKVADLFNLIGSTLGGLDHKIDCDLKLMKGICSCGLGKARIDSMNLMKKLMGDKVDGETKV